MDQGKALYEFISRYAYFAYPATILIENYSACDGNRIESDILLGFLRYMNEYSDAQTKVANGKIDSEVADVNLRTAVNLLRQQTVINFLSILRNQIVRKNKFLDIEIETGSLSKIDQDWVIPYEMEYRQEKKDSNIRITAGYLIDKLFTNFIQEMRKSSFNANMLVKFMERIRKVEEIAQIEKGGTDSFL